jgi:magnesium-transporting ATPase (P-type)
VALGAGRIGLSSTKAAARRLRYGPNTLEERRRLSLPLKFLSRFRNPLVIILLAAAVISATVFFHEWSEPGIAGEIPDGYR